MSRLIFALAALALASCKPAAADGYAFERAEFARDAIQLTIVRHATPAALRREADRLGVRVESDRKLAAFGMVGADKPTCTIHIVDPSVNYQPEWIGHEVTHCIAGRWHQ